MTIRFGKGISNYSNFNCIDSDNLINRNKILKDHLRWEKTHNSCDDLYSEERCN